MNYLKNKNDYFTSIAVAIIAALSMGTIGLIARLSALDAEVITFFRLFIAGLLIIIITIPFYKLTLFFKTPDIKTLVSGILLASFILFYIQSVKIGSLIVSIMTLYLAPVLATIFSQILHGTKIPRSSYTSVCGVLIGFFMVLNFFDHTLSFNLYNFLYSIVAMLCYTGFILTNKTKKEDIPILVHSGVQLFVGAIVILPFISMNNIVSLTSSQWLWVLLIGFVPGFLGLVCAIYAIQKLSTVTYATISYVEPISTLTFAWLIFSEPLNISQSFGCILIVFFSLYQVYNERKNHINLALQ